MPEGGQVCSRTTWCIGWPTSTHSDSKWASSSSIVLELAMPWQLQLSPNPQNGVQSFCHSLGQSAITSHSLPCQGGCLWAHMPNQESRHGSQPVPGFSHQSIQILPQEHVDLKEVPWQTLRSKLNETQGRKRDRGRETKR